MATMQMNSAIGRLRQMVGRADAAALSDGELLERFQRDRDETAFEVLIARHGPLVWNACRRVLDEHLAEDAFQATFLTLARKGGSIAKSAALAAWLHRVAQRIALAARMQAVQRARREVRAQRDAGPTDESNWAEVRTILDAEIDRLPDKYRLPVIKCYLEGKTTTQAAGELGCPAGTVGTRLAWARERLRERLTRRGVTLSAVALAGSLSQGLAGAAVPPTLTAAALGCVVGSASIPAGVLFLSKGALHTMLIGKLKLYASAILAAACLLATGALLWSGSAGQVPEKAPVEIARAQPADKGKDKKDTAKKSDELSFTTIAFTGVGRVTVRQDDVNSVKVVGAETLAKWRVDGGTLFLEGVTDFEVSVKRPAVLMVSGVGTLKATGIDVKHLKVVVQKAGILHIAGKADSLQLLVEGPGSFDGADLVVQEATVGLTGPARAVVHATRAIKGSVTGPGRLEHIGPAEVTVAAPIPAEVRARAGTAKTPPPIGKQPIVGKKAKNVEPLAKQPPAGPASLKLTASVDGWTQATMFNPQKYPFKYQGTGQLDAAQLQSLSKPGEIPAATAKALLGCLLWPGKDDNITRAKLTSDGKKLTGDAEILHKYGTQGTHTLKLKLDGTLDTGKLSLRVIETTVAGTWSFGGNGIVLKGEAVIKIDTERP